MTLIASAFTSFALRLHDRNEKEQESCLEKSKQQLSQKQNEQQQQQQQQQQKQTLRDEEQRQQEQCQAQLESQQMQHQQTLQHMQQQQYQQQCMQQQYQQQCMQQFMMPWLPPVFVSPRDTTAEAVAEPVPYGRALSTLRHKHDAAIKRFFEARGLCVGEAPVAASLAETFN
jgi:hypothetical protein